MSITMKSPVARFLVLLPLFVGLSTSSQTKTETSLADTLQWLADSTAKQTSRFGTKFTFRSEGPDGCSVVLEEHLREDGATPAYTEKTIFSLADIDPNSIHVGGSRPTDRGIPGVFQPSSDQVWFDTTNHIKTIIRADDELSATTGETAIEFNAEFAPKFVARLKHAVELCGVLALRQTKTETSLADTLQWLTDSTAKQASKDGAKFAFKSEGANGCSVVLERPRATKTSFSLADIDPYSIHVGGTQDPAVTGVSPPSPDEVLFHTTNYVETITDTVEGFPPSHRGEIVILFSPEFTTKFVPQLKRAVALCGGIKSSSPLPDFVFEFDMPTATSLPIHSYQPLKAENIDTKYYSVIPRPHYRLCKEVSREVRLEGGSDFQRTRSAGALLYVGGTYPDGVFWTTSVASAHIKILEVPSEVADTRCPSLEDAFPTVVERGPAYGWESMYRYMERNGNGTGTGDSNSVDVNAPPGTVYCTHKFSFSGRGGRTDYGLGSWTATSMVMGILATSGSQMGGGSNIGLTLFVKYVPPSERDKSGCTVMPPPWFARRPFPKEPRQISLPGGFFMYEP
jgi:hypothetical protein